MKQEFTRQTMIYGTGLTLSAKHLKSSRKSDIAAYVFPERQSPWAHKPG